MGKAWLVGYGVDRILALERREARRVGLVSVEVAHIDDLAGQRHGRAVEAKRRQAVVTRIAERRIDLAVVGDDDRGAEFVGHHMGPRAGRAMRETQRRPVGREGEGPALGERWRRLDGARLVKPRLQVGLGERRQSEPLGDEPRRADRVVGAPDNELRFGMAAGRQFDFKGEARGGIEGPELALVVEFSRAHGLASRGAGERSFAQKTRARILVTDEPGAGAGLHREERSLAAIGARRSQQAIAREDRVEGADEDRLDMHAGEIEIARIGAGLVAGDFAEADEAQAARPAGEVFEADAPAQNRALGVRRGLHRRAHALKRIGDHEAIEPGLFDAIFARALRRLVADRPWRPAVFAQIEEMPARLQRIERSADEVDREAAALVGHDMSRAASVAHEIETDRAVVECEAARQAAQGRGRAGEGQRRRAGPLARAGGDDERRHAEGGAGDSVRERDRLDRARHRPAPGERLRAGPRLVPIRAARDVKGNEQRRPRAETPDRVRDRPRARAVAEKSRHRFVDAVAAEEGKIDQRRHAQAHVIEPDEHAQPVVGEQADEHRHAEIAEIAGRKADLGAGRDERAHRTVLIIPRGMGGLAQESVDDRRHP